MLLAWTRLIQKHDPDIITGYNINGFDFQYMKDRADKHKILKKLLDIAPVQLKINEKFLLENAISKSLKLDKKG